jgi:hypothetical protein
MLLLRVCAALAAVRHHELHVRLAPPGVAFMQAVQRTTAAGADMRGAASVAAMLVQSASRYVPAAATRAVETQGAVAVTRVGAVAAFMAGLGARARPANALTAALLPGMTSKEWSDGFAVAMAKVDHGLRALRCIRDIDAWRVMTPSFDLQMRASGLVTAPVLHSLAPPSAAALIADARAMLLATTVQQRRLNELFSGQLDSTAPSDHGHFFARYAPSDPLAVSATTGMAPHHALWPCEAVLLSTPACDLPFFAGSGALPQAPPPQSSVTRITIFAAESSFAHVAAVLEGVGVWSVMSGVPRAVRAILLDPAGCDHGSGEIEERARGSGSEDEDDEDCESDGPFDSDATRNYFIDADAMKRKRRIAMGAPAPAADQPSVTVHYRGRAHCITVVFVPPSLRDEAEASPAAPVPALPGVTTAAVALAAAATAARGDDVYSRAAAGADAVVVLAAAATDVVTDDGEPAALHAVVARLAAAFDGTAVTHESVIAYAATLRGEVFASAAASAGAGAAAAVATNSALQPRPPPAFLRLAMRPEAAAAAKALPAPFPARLGKGGEADSVLVVPSGQILSASGPMLLEWVARAVPARPSGGSYDLSVPRRCLRLPLPTTSG